MYLRRGGGRSVKLSAGQGTAGYSENGLRYSHPLALRELGGHLPSALDVPVQSSVPVIPSVHGIVEGELISLQAVGQANGYRDQ